MIPFWSSVAAAAIAAVGCGCLLAAAILVARMARDHTRSRAGGLPAVTILKPLHGGEPGLFENLASFCTQDYPGRIQVVFGVQDPDDAAIAIVERLRELAPACDLDLVIDSTLHGLNRKVSNLINMAPHIRHEVIVLSDSDMRVGPDYLARVVAALTEPRTGAVTCLYYGAPLTGLWARLSALAINAHFLPSVVVGRALGLARPCFGSTLALRRETLEEIGGFTAFVGCLADDYAIGQAVRARGYAVSIPPFAIAHMCAQSSLRELWQHELRWARTIRSIDAAGYAGSLVAHPLPWALIALVVGLASPAMLPAIAVAAAAIACRMALLWQVQRRFALPPQRYWLVPARDLLSFAVFVVSFLGRDVSWKGHRFRMGAGGTWVVEGGSHRP
jgi:ceramide glucosyltransferase